MLQTNDVRLPYWSHENIVVNTRMHIPHVDKIYLRPEQKIKSV